MIACFKIHFIAVLCITSLVMPRTYANPLIIKVAKEAAIITASGVGCAALWATQEIALYGKEEGLLQIKTKVTLLKMIAHGVGKKTVELIKSKL